MRKSERNNSADTKVSEEVQGRGVPGGGADSSAAYGEDHSGTDHLPWMSVVEQIPTLQPMQVHLVDVP